MDGASNGGLTVVRDGGGVEEGSFCGRSEKPRDEGYSETFLGVSVWFFSVLSLCMLYFV